MLQYEYWGPSKLLLHTVQKLQQVLSPSNSTFKNYMVDLNFECINSPTTISYDYLLTRILTRLPTSNLLHWTRSLINNILQSKVIQLIWLIDPMNVFLLFLLSILNFLLVQESLTFSQIAFLLMFVTKEKISNFELKNLMN